MIRSWLLPLMTLSLAVRAERRYRRLPEVPQLPTASSLQPLSVVVPARNEAANLQRLLPSLAAERYPGDMEIIVVDDGSTDGTASVAAEHGARVVRLSGPRPGWLGKPHACHRGAELAAGAWLLFTDADTVHAPDGPRRAVAWAERADLDGLSVFLDQEPGIWADRAVLLAAFAGFFAGLRSYDGVLNGQYLLLRRDVYWASGGFAAVRGEPLEDLALGHQLHRLGRQVPVLHGERLARVRMYRAPLQMWQGLTRLGALSLRWSGLGGLYSAIFILGTAAPVALLPRALIRRSGRLQALLVWVLAAVGVAPWSRRFSGGWWWLLAPVGAAVVQAAALWGLLSRLAGRGVLWKDRVL